MSNAEHEPGRQACPQRTTLQSAFIIVVSFLGTAHLGRHRRWEPSSGLRGLFLHSCEVVASTANVRAAPDLPPVLALALLPLPAQKAQECQPSDHQRRAEQLCAHSLSLWTHGRISYT